MQKMHKTHKFVRRLPIMVLAAFMRIINKHLEDDLAPLAKAALGLSVVMGT
jgi:hypothetical protein